MTKCDISNTFQKKLSFTQVKQQRSSTTMAVMFKDSLQLVFLELCPGIPNFPAILLVADLTPYAVLN